MMKINKKTLKMLVLILPFVLLLSFSLSVTTAKYVKTDDRLNTATVAKYQVSVTCNDSDSYVETQVLGGSTDFIYTVTNTGEITVRIRLHLLSAVAGLPAVTYDPAVTANYTDWFTIAPGVNKAFKVTVPVPLTTELNVDKDKNYANISFDCEQVD